MGSVTGRGEKMYCIDDLAKAAVECPVWRAFDNVDVGGTREYVRSHGSGAGIAQYPLSEVLGFPLC